MIKLKSLLKEDADDNILLKISNELKNKRQFRTLLLRRVPINLENLYRLAKIRNDRNLRNSQEHINIFLIKISKMLGKYIPDRRKSLFTTNSINVSKIYDGDLTVIFPGKKSKVIYNESYSDSYGVTNSHGFFRGDIIEITSSEEFKKNIIKLNLTEYYKLIFDILKPFLLNKIDVNQLENNMNNVDFIKLESEIKILYEKYSQSTDEVSYIIVEQYKTFKKMVSYIENMKFLKKNDYIKQDVEFIIYGPDEYLQVDYDLFVSNFRWNGNEWEIRTMI